MESMEAAGETEIQLLNTIQWIEHEALQAFRKRIQL